MSIDEYEGPPVDCAPETIKMLRRRVDKIVRARAEEIHRNEVAAWAAANSGAYPTIGDASSQASEEIEILCGGLGEWAAVRPTLVFDGPLEDWLLELIEQ